MIVVDASAAVHLLCRTAELSDRIDERLRQESVIHVPMLFELEALQALRGLEAARALAEPAAKRALGDLSRLRLERHDHRPLLPWIWRLRHNLTTYDASYVALAQALRAPLLTSDRGLARSFGHDAQIELIG